METVIKFVGSAFFGLGSVMVALPHIASFFSNPELTSKQVIHNNLPIMGLGYGLLLLGAIAMHIGRER